MGRVEYLKESLSCCEKWDRKLLGRKGKEALVRKRKGRD